MKCMNCGQDNKDSAKTCRKCGRDMTIAPAWFPDWKWHAKTISAIYAAVIIFYFGVSFLLRRLPKPYNIRHIPIEMTPWLRHGKKFLSDTDLKAPPLPPAPSGNP
ncbi:MAG: zinc ribbon domain-containing protein [Elusimicrobiota bacterium]